MLLDSYPKEPNKEDSFPLFRLKEKESPGIRQESKSPTVLRLCLGEQNQGFEDLLVGAIVSAPWALAPVRYPLPTSLTVIHPAACPATDPQAKVKVGIYSRDFCLAVTKTPKKG